VPAPIALGPGARVIGPAEPLLTEPAATPSPAAGGASTGSAAGVPASLSGITAGMGLGAAAQAPEVHTDAGAGAEAQRWSGYLQKVAQIAGADAVCLFEVASGHAWAHVGHRPEANLLGRHGSALLSAVGDAGRGLSLSSAAPDLTISLPQHHLIVHPLPGKSGLALHIVLDRSASNLMLTRVQLQRLDDEWIAAQVAAQTAAPLSAPRARS
jgi:hypothetical protein